MASKTVSIAFDWPSALSTCASRWPSARRIALCFSPSAGRIWDCLEPSAWGIDAGRSRWARSCFSDASWIVPGGSIGNLSALVAATTIAAPALADQALATAKNCMACHAVDKKLVGPAYNDVAVKYKGDAKAHAALEGKVKKGGAGVWGQVPMPPNPQVPDADIKTMVTYVLGLKK